MTFIEIIAQIIGALAAATFIASYQMKHRRWILILGAVARVLFTVQYVLLGAYVGAALDVLGILAVLIAARKDHPTVQKLLFPLITLVHVSILALTAIFYQNWTDIFVMLGMTLHTAALWFSREKRIRYLSLCGSPCWLAYNLANKAFFPAINDVFSITSLLVAIFRYDLKRKKAE